MEFKDLKVGDTIKLTGYTPGDYFIIKIKSIKFVYNHNVITGEYRRYRKDGKFITYYDCGHFDLSGNEIWEPVFDFNFDLGI